MYNVTKRLPFDIEKNVKNFGSGLKVTLKG